MYIVISILLCLLHIITYNYIKCTFTIFYYVINNKQQYNVVHSVINVVLCTSSDDICDIDV